MVRFNSEKLTTRYRKQTAGDLKSDNLIFLYISCYSGSLLVVNNISDSSPHELLPLVPGVRGNGSLADPVLPNICLTKCKKPGKDIILCLLNNNESACRFLLSAIKKQAGALLLTKLSLKTSVY